MNSFSEDLWPTATGLTPSSGGGGITGTPVEKVELHPDRPWLSKTGTVSHEMLEIPVDLSKMP